MNFNEEDIRPKALMADKAACIEHDRRYLLDRRDGWVNVNCPACGLDDARPYGEKQGFRYVECSACGTVYTNPRPSEELSHAFYAQSMNYAYWNRHIFPATEEVRRARIFAPRAARLARYCRELGFVGGALLEVGAAYGTFCEEIRALGLFDRVIAVEPTPGLAETCRRRGFETLEMPIERVEGLSNVDVVAAFEVLEHLFSPRAFIRSCKALMRPGGLLVVSCPNVRGFDVATLRMLSGTFDHEHVNYFHPDSLSLLLGREGFRVRIVETPGQLDADIVHKRVIDGQWSVEDQPLLKEVFVRRWDVLGGPFQQFLAENRLSSHMWAVAERLP